MDINHLFIQTFSAFLAAYWWFLLIVILVACLRTSFIKGVIGEFQINLAVNLLLDKQRYRVTARIRAKMGNSG